MLRKRKQGGLRRSGKRQRVAKNAKSKPYKRKYRAGPRRKRRTRGRKRYSKTTVTNGNIQTYIQQYADSVQVPVRGTSGLDTFGKPCQYMYPGVGGQDSYALGGIRNKLRMADVIATQDIAAQNQFGAQVNPSAPLSETKYQILDAYQRYHYVNQSNSIAVMTLYYCIARTDVQFANNETNIRSIIGDGFIQRGLGSTQSGGNFYINDDELTPYDSHRFCSYFKIYKTERVLADPGRNVMRTIKMGTTMVDTARLSFTNVTGTGALPSQNPQYAHVKGEKFILLKVTGQPSDDGGANLSYTSPKIDMITVNHYNYRSVCRQQPLIFKDTAVNFTTFTAAPQIMVDESGTVQPQTFA